jgi:PAS domain S-box-containing protein
MTLDSGAIPDILERAVRPESALPPEIDQLNLAYIEIDAHGLITRVNRAAMALHHPAHGELVGKTGWDLMAGDEKIFSQAAFSAQLQSGMPPPVITRNLFDRSGSFRTYQLHRNLMLDSTGNPSGMSMIAVDVTELTEAVDEARRALRWLENAVQSLSDAVFLIDSMGIVRSMNAAAEALSGYSAADFVGKSIEEISPLIDYEPLDQIPFTHRSAIERPCHGIATLLNRNQRQVRVEMRTSPIVDKARGTVAGVIALLRKMTETK